MDYSITNGRQYIRLGMNGSPITCSRKECGEFEYSKAKNILDNLPKHLKRMGFSVRAIPEIKPPDPVKRVLETKDKNICENITRWVEKFGVCQDTIDEARARFIELSEELSQVDKEYIDISHEIEIQPSKDLYNGWLKYKQIQDNRLRRREIKDEQTLIGSVIEQLKENHFSRERTMRKINGLKNRKYTYRVIDID